MSKTPNNPYAFPKEEEYGSQSGMTLRDYFAGHAISHSFASGMSDEYVAKYAYAIADAMLAERNK